jgi:hypothetical protein
VNGEQVGNPGPGIIRNPKIKEAAITLGFCLIAAALVASALWFDPGAATPEILTDQGQLFYPGFTDPQLPKVIEVVDYDEAMATARPLKVEYKNHKWSIPSHYGYPADAEERLAKTAAALIDLKKDAIVSDRTEDQAAYGVIDPLDQNATSLTGRGKRVTLRDTNGGVLADFIIGKAAEGKAGYRYMRVPNQPRIYLVKTDADVSARFEDWIETDLLKLATADIRKITINSYSINESFGMLQNVETLVLVRNDSRWTLNSGETLRKERIDGLTGALSNLRIVDVQPKPMGLSRDLKTPQGIQLSPESLVSLRQKGFFVTPMGQLLSNEGELLVEMASGLLYTLRFGEVATSSSNPSTEPTGGTKEAAKDTGERRYLFVTVSYSPARAQQFAQDGRSPSQRGQQLEQELRNRFADWYYIISGTDFRKLRPKRQDLVRG